MGQAEFKPQESFDAANIDYVSYQNFRRTYGDAMEVAQRALS